LTTFCDYLFFSLWFLHTRLIKPTDIYKIYKFYNFFPLNTGEELDVFIGIELKINWQFSDKIKVFLNLLSSHLRNFCMHNNTQTPNEKKCFLSPLFFLPLFALLPCEHRTLCSFTSTQYNIFFSKKSSINVIIIFIFWMFHLHAYITSSFALALSLSLSSFGSSLHIHTFFLLNFTQKKYHDNDEDIDGVTLWEY
jgi:hypothetical protein